MTVFVLRTLSLMWRSILLHTVRPITCIMSLYMHFILFHSYITLAHGYIHCLYIHMHASVRAGNRSGSPNVFFNRLTMVRIGAVNFR